MGDALSMVWWTSALGGGLAALTAAVAPRVRRKALFTASALLLLAGVLGILSIGVLFLVAATACAVLATRTRKVHGDHGR